MSRFGPAQKLSINTLALILLASLAGCGKSSGGGGITIAQTDTTGPILTFSVGVSGNTPVTVTNGGSAQNINLTSKTGSLNLVANATDSESGVQRVAIWFNTTTTRCVGTVCTQKGAGLLGAPTFDSTSPQKKAGENTPPQSILADSVDLSKEIAQASVPAGSSYSVVLTFWAESVNHLGVVTKSPNITVSWFEQ